MDPNQEQQAHDKPDFLHFIRPACDILNVSLLLLYTYIVVPLLDATYHNPTPGTCAYVHMCRDAAHNELDMKQAARHTQPSRKCDPRLPL